jgi:hypothetical protein
MSFNIKTENLYCSSYSYNKLQYHSFPRLVDEKVLDLTITSVEMKNSGSFYYSIYSKHIDL